MTSTIAPQPSATQPIPVSTVGASAPAPAAPGIVGPPGSNPVSVRILAINDFHGQLGPSDAKLGAEQLGGAATLATYINQERAGNPNGTVFVSAGDLFGASQPESSLLDHASTIATLAAMGLDLATLGNHEFDRGFAEIMRLINGGAKKRKKRGKSGKASPAPPAWPGSPFPWVSASIVNAKTGKPVLKPYQIREVNGVKVAFIGATTKDLKNLSMASSVAGLNALDPADAINAYIPEIKAQGVRTIIAMVHEGGDKDPKTGEITGVIADIAKRLDPEVDVVISAHSHKEYSGKVAGKIVTQALSYAKAFAEVDLAVDPKTDQVVAGSAKVVHNDVAKVTPDPTVAKMVDVFHQAVAGRTERVVSVLPGAVTRQAGPSGESALGTLLAEAERWQSGAQLAVMNPGGIRADIAAGGPVTWGKLFTVQPFGNTVIVKKMSGARILAVLEQMFRESGDDTMLQVAGMRVVFDRSRPKGHRIVKVLLDSGGQINPKATYSIAMNSFLAQGGDGFTELGKGKVLRDAGDDLRAFDNYLAAGNPVPTGPVGRLVSVGGAPHGDRSS